VLQIGHWQFDEHERVLRRDRREEHLPLKVAEVLRLLAQRAGEVVTREELITHAWDGNQYTGPRGLTNAIWQLRRLLDEPTGEDGAAVGSEAIVTIAKKGYRLALPVRRTLPGVATPEPRSAQAPNRPAAPATRPALRRWAIALGLAAVLAASLGGLWRYRKAPQTLPAPKPVSLTTLDGMEEYPDVSPDGAWLAFTWEREDQPARIYLRALGPGEAAPQPLPSQSPAESAEVRPVWLGGHEHLAFARLDAAGRCEVLVRDRSSADERSAGPCFYERLHQIFDAAPDGQALAIARQEPRADTIAIYLHPLDGGGETQLTHPDEGAQDSQLSWSPDGRRIAFIRRTVNVGEVYVLELSSGEERRLTMDQSSVYGLGWLDADTVVFNSMRGGDYELWRIAADGGSPSRYAGLPTPFNMSIWPGQPGSLVVSQHRTAEHHELYRVSDGRLLGSLSSSGRDLYAQWSAGSGRLVLLSTRDGRWTIWTMAVDGSDARPLPGVTGTPSITVGSPSDARIATTLRAPSGEHDRLMIAANDREPLQAVIQDRHDYRNVSWDGGEAVLVDSNRGGSWELWRYTLADGSFQRLTDDAAVYGLRLRSDDADWLYYTRQSLPGIWRKPFTGGPSVPVVDDLGVDDWGNWTLHDQQLFYVRRDADGDRVMRCALDGSGQETLVHLPRNAIRYYRSVSITSDGRLILTILGRRQADIVGLRQGQSP
jgi:Tol biopolymer transport system component/DNA-binding winged helix-turn-helix (wHTH) protein